AYVPSLGLGSASVSPLDMASAYATIAAGGIYSEPMAIRKVVLPDGKVDEGAGWGQPERRRVIPDWVAGEVTKILEDNMDEGTGTGARVSFYRPAGGKTGTTDDHTDAWFCGYTPTLSTTVWVGYPQAQIPMENVHGISVAGGTFPATIWNLFMRSTIGNTPEGDFPEPRSSPHWRDFSEARYANEYYYTPPSYYSPSPSYPPSPSPSPRPTAPPRPRPPRPPPPPRSRLARPPLEDDDAVLVEHARPPAAPDQASERDSSRRRRGAAVEVGGVAEVDRDPFRFTHNRKAEDSPASREMRAQPVRGRHGRGRRG